MADSIGGGTDLVTAGRVNGGHPKFDTAQEAIDYAESNSYRVVVFPKGEFGPISVNSVRVVGASKGASGTAFFSDDANPAITVTGFDYTELAHINFDTNGGTGQPALRLEGNQIAVTDCFFLNSDAEAIVADGNYAHIYSCHVGGSAGTVLFTANSKSCTYTGNSAGTVTNNGTGNVITDNS